MQNSELSIQDSGLAADAQPVATQRLSLAILHFEFCILNFGRASSSAGPQ
jgi:hypothetical protein